MNPEKFTIDRSKVVHDTIEGETIVINLDSGAYYALNQTAGEVWNWIDSGLDKPRILTLLRESYAIEEPEAHAALSPFLDKLVLEGLVLLSTDIVPSGQANGHQAHIAPNEKQPFVAPQISVFTDMADFLKVDPIHEVDEQGWPHKKADQPGKAH